MAGDPEQGRAAPISAAVDAKWSAPRAEQSGSLQPRRAAAGNDFIDQRHLPDPRSPDRVLDGGDDVAGAHPAAAYPLCKALGTRMADDVAELETRPAEPKRDEKPDLAPTRKNDDQPQQKFGTSKDRQVQEGDKLPAPLPRWPFVLVGLVVAICVAGVL